MQWDGLMQEPCSASIGSIFMSRDYSLSYQPITSSIIFYPRKEAAPGNHHSIKLNSNYNSNQNSVLSGFPSVFYFHVFIQFFFFSFCFFLYVRVCVCLFSLGTSFFRLFRLLLRWVIFDPFDTKMNSAPKTELVFFFLFVTEVRILSLRHNGHCWLDISTSAAVLQSPFRWRFNCDAIVSLDEMSQCHCRNAIVACRIPIFDWFLCRLSGKGPGERWGIRTGTALCCQLNALVKSRSQSNKRQTSVWIAGLTAR